MARMVSPETQLAGFIDKFTPVFSIAAQAKGVSLCFLQGAGLPDPHGLLRGSGNVVRNVRLEGVATLAQPEVLALIDVARRRAKVPFGDGEHRLIIRSVSAKQRPRRPVEKAKKKKKA